jgi:hypothetical protein
MWGGNTVNVLFLLVLLLIMVVNILLIYCKYFWHENCCFLVKLVAGYFCKHPNYLLFSLLIIIVNMLLICCKDSFFLLKLLPTIIVNTQIQNVGFVVNLLL